MLGQMCPKIVSFLERNEIASYDGFYGRIHGDSVLQSIQLTKEIIMSYLL